MKKKGFTLIELLAVIVVLAVIALIATPIVTRTIENSKRGAAVESVSNMIKTAELYFITSNPKYGKINLLDENLNYSGQKPELGEVELNKDGHARIYAYVNGYCVTKEFDTELYASKMNKEDCDWFATDNYETTEGTTFTLNNQTIKNYLIYGNSIQETRSGKNLFNPSAWSTKATANGLTVQYLEDEDCFLINGTATQNDIVVEKRVNISSSANTSYVLSTRYVSGSVDRTNGGGSKWAVAYFGNGDTIDTNNNWYAINLQNEDSVTTSKINDKSYITRFWFYVNKGVTFNDYKVKIQLEEGTSATSYEKYGVMPSPEFPSEVKSTGDLLTSSNCASYGSDACNNIDKYVVQVKNRGKNLFNVDDFISTFNSYKASDYQTTKTSFGGYDCIKVYGTLSIDGRNIQYLKNQFKDNTQYTFSLDIYDVNGGINNYVGISSIIEYTDGTSDVFVSTARNFDEWKTITLTSKANKTISYIRLDYGTGSAYSYIKNWQIEEGTSVTPYESYKEKTTNIYLTEPLRKVGDYADYIDFANNKVVRYIKNIDLSKCTIGLYTYNNLKGVNIINALDETKSRVAGLSNREDKIGKYYDSTGHYMWIGVNNTTAYWVGILDYLGISTVTEFQQWIKANPVSIYYALTTPTEETIDLPNIELLDGSSTLSINTSVSPSNVRLTTNK